MGVITETYRIDGVEKAEADLRRMAQAAEMGGDALTASEKEALKAITATNAALVAKAKATGLTVQEIKHLEAETAKLVSMQAKAATSTEAVAASTGKAQRGMMAMAQQLPDVVTQLSMGADTMQVLSVQGLQVVQSMGLMEGAMAAVSSMAGPLAIGLAAVVAAGSLVANAMHRAADATDTSTRSTEEIRAAAAAAAADVQTYAESWQSVTRAMEDSTTAIRVINGELTANQAAAAAQIKTVEAAAQSELLALGRAVAVAREARAADPTRENIAAQRTAEEALAAKKAELAALRENINGIAEFRDESDKATEAERKRAEAQRAREQAQREALAADKEAVAAMEELIRQEERLREAEMARAEEQRKGFEESVKMAEEQDAKFREMDKRAEDAQRAKEAAGTSGSKAAAAAQDIAAIGQAAAGGLAGIAGAVNPIAGALVSVFLNMEEIVGGLVKEIRSLPQRLVEMPSLLGSLVTASAEAIPALFKALPKMVEELITVFLSPEVVGAIARIAIEGVLLTFGADPRLYIAIVRGIVDAVPELVRAWIQAMKALPQQLLTGGRESMREWGPRNRNAGPNITVNGMVGDGVRLGAGIRGLFDRDFGRVRARS